LSEALGLSYVLPLKWTEDADRDDLTRYLKEIAELVEEVIVVDGSDGDDFELNASAWGSFVRHIPVDADLNFSMGKVNGVTTGVRAATHDRVVIADDDVRYRPAELRRVHDLLDDAELVRPQNYFVRPMPWHAALDTARTLLNRSIAADYPGTLAVRRSLFMKMGGYDGDVMFENLELIRTIQANGGRVVSPLDVYVERQPPSTGRYFSQRARQAYDDFTIPARMATWLAVLPVVRWIWKGRRIGVASSLAGGTVLLAEIGRRRGGGDKVFPFVSSLLAPVWVLERGVSSWAAVYQLLTGGVRYGGGKIKKAANRRPPARFRSARGT
jgi:hypothetical protein